jgi:hypothetical protein
VNYIKCIERTGQSDLSEETQGKVNGEIKTTLRVVGAQGSGEVHRAIKKNFKGNSEDKANVTRILNQCYALATGQMLPPETTEPAAPKPQKSPGPGKGHKTRVTADAIAGRWRGTATPPTGKSFQVDLTVKKGCVVGHSCGTIAVSHMPCHGAISLEKVAQDDYEFRVDQFDAASASGCTPGAGEHFRRQPDGTLLYSTTYDHTRGALSPVSD